jgi:hypothetical protein
MTTFKTLAAQVIRILTDNGRTQDSRLDDRVIIRELRQAASEMIKAEWVVSKREFGETSAISGQFIGKFRGVEILVDEDTKENYCVIPGSYINLYSGKGILRVSPSSRRLDQKAMIPILPHEMDIYRNLNSGKEVMKGNFCFFVEGPRLYFSEMNKKTLLDRGIKKVDIVMATMDPQTVGDDQNYPMPADMEMSVMKAVLQIHGLNFQEDMLNDGNDTTKNKVDDRTLA